jgi:hypothetical protein
MVILLWRFRQDVLSVVVLLSQVESELLDKAEHEGVVLADPGGSAIHRAVLGQLQPLEVAVRAVLGGVPQGQRANATANAIGGLEDNEILPMLGEDEGALEGRYSTTYYNVLVMTQILHQL